MICISAIVILVTSISACITGDDDADPTFVIEPTATGPAVVSTPTTIPAAIPTPIACAVTEPAEEPPQEVSLLFQQNPDWYGSQNLWASPVSIAAIRGRTPEQPGLWYVGDMVVLWFGAEEDLEIVGTLQESDVSLEMLSQDLQPMNDTPFTNTVLRFPEPGCWDISAVSGEQMLDIVVNVSSFEERPDVIAALAIRDRQQPYPAPVSCAVTEWVGPQDRGVFSLNASYWLGDGDISATSFTGVLWEGETNQLFWVTPDPADTSTFELTGTNRDRPGSLVRSSTNIRNDFLVSDVVFPGDGCWELTAETPTESATFTVYVYPATCKPDSVSGEIPESCEIPVN